MNNQELDRILHSAPVPDRPAGYWEAFPRRVTAKVHWRPKAPVAESVPRTRRWAWASILGVSAAAACVLVGFALGYWRGRGADDVSVSVAEARKYFQEIAPMFPHQVQTIMFDRQGAHLVLSESADVPDSTPVYVKVCGPKGCENFVTFSGQKIQVNGDVFDVLLNHRGEVLLVGQQSAWSSAGASSSLHDYRITARPLTGAS